MFKDIEKLVKGDRIYIRNHWETLQYVVMKTEIIEPNEIEKVWIQEGKDMITLITCHPYPTNKQRYLVYAQRATKDHEETGTLTTKEPASTASQKRIEKDAYGIAWLSDWVLVSVFSLVFFLALQTKASLKDRYHLHNLNSFRRLVYAYIASS